MKRYKLKMDIPAYKRDEEFHLSKKGNLVHTKSGNLAYSKGMLKAYPSVLKDWFEEIPEEPKTVWDLKHGDKCWVRAARGILFGYEPVSPMAEYWDGNPQQQSLREIGSVFLTKEECQQNIDWNKAREVLKRDAKGFKPDWSDKELEADAWFVVWDTYDGKLRVDYTIIYQENKIYFATREAAEASIEAHEKEWKTYLGVEEQ